MSEKIAVIGLGYVGLPLLIGLARHFETVVGFDIDARRVAALNEGNDWTKEVAQADLAATTARMTASVDDIAGCDLFIVTVPTPIDRAKRPDLTPVLGACRTLSAVLKKRVAAGIKGKTPLFVFESTVWPGLTEDICAKTIEAESGLSWSKDFKLGYSPERINPGDKVHRVETIKKIISAEDDESLDRLEEVYGKVITAGLHKASSIRVAEAAKVLENTQRDINIALMNELALICDRIGIRTHDVLAAAGTKWNFLPFTPGLVGGHCIGVDPYYLTARAEELGYNPQVILAGRRINDSIPFFIAQKTVKLLSGAGRMRAGARVGILGLTFKENVPDLRNSRVPEIIGELQSFGVDVFVHDPVADPNHARHEYGLELCARGDLKNLDALILAVPHQAFLDDMNAFLKTVLSGGFVMDVKSALTPADIPDDLNYWSL